MKTQRESVWLYRCPTCGEEDVSHPANKVGFWCDGETVHCPEMHDGVRMVRVQEFVACTATPSSGNTRRDNDA